MFELEIHHEGRIRYIKTDGKDLLLQVLRHEGYDIYAPCGGNGTCGKCKVWIRDEGSVSSCVFPVSNYLKVILPDKKEAQILVAQHEHTVKLPFMPGSAANLSSYPHGVAIDIGTTSLVFYLVNLFTGSIVETRAELNPQTNFGGDVISRINYTSQNTNGLSELQDLLIKSINRQLDHFIDLLNIAIDDIVKISIAGNTTMLHLLLRKDPLPIALAPFTPQFTEAQNLEPAMLNLHCNTGAEVKTLPCVSAYVGADIVAGIASIEPSESYKNYIFMDIGTNGELALVTAGKIWCCATAAGPAFEGDRIVHGMTATEGAISAYGSKDFTVIGDVRPMGICGSGLIDVVAYLLDVDLIDSDGLIAEDFVVAKNDQSGTSKAIVLTQQDIREVQLAKSAIAAGVNILLKMAEFDPEDVDVVFLAGGFGNYINIQSAMKIGLISSIFKDKVIPLGNTSGSGAIQALKSVKFDDVIQSLLDKTEYIELSDNEDFTMDFAMNMMFYD